MPLLLDREAGMKKLTYKKSGVDIAAATLFKSKIKNIARRSFSKDLLAGIGGFGSLFKLNKEKYKEPVLVSSSDGVGTKLKIAELVNKHDTIGIDAVAMNVNDILCVGAKPLFFLDYIAYSKLKGQVLIDIVKGITKGCIESGSSLIGGETAQMPGMYKQGEYDIAGFCVGIVEKSRIIDGSRIKPKDLIIGLESSGLHSNGYSLVRKALSQKEVRRMSKELLMPTKIYVNPILDLLRLENFDITGIANITGGAFYDKIARILPKSVDAKIDKNSWVVPKIFRLIQNKGNVPEEEMYHTLNMGIGMIIVASCKQAGHIISRLKTHGLKSWVIGEITKGKGLVKIM